MERSKELKEKVESMTNDKGWICPFDGKHCIAENGNCTECVINQIIYINNKGALKTPNR